MTKVSVGVQSQSLPKRRSAFRRCPSLGAVAGCWLGGASWLAGCSASGGGANGDGPGVILPNTPSETATMAGGDSSPNPLPVQTVMPTFDTTDLESTEPEAGCQQASRSFDPEIPTVFILLDRSDSMFSGNNAVWSPLRSGVLQVIEELQDSVRFAFAAFTGENGGTCPDMQTAEAGLSNYSNIADLYMSLGQATLENQRNKETPTVAALDVAADVLWSDEGTGGKYILYVTDGEPDYCDDNNAICPTDSVTGKLQQLSLGLDSTQTSREPIHTFVFGLESENTNIPPATLQAFANAGAGEPVARLSANGQTYGENNRTIFADCNGSAGWMEYFSLTGKPAVATETTADYSLVGGNAPVFRPDPNDQDALVGQIRSALAGVKSCEFNLGEDGVQVDLERADLGEKAKVELNGQAIVMDDPNGWRLTDPSTVQLVGEACDTWRAPVETSINFDFPCDIIVLY